VKFHQKQGWTDHLKGLTKVQFQTINGLRRRRRHPQQQVKLHPHPRLRHQMKLNRNPMNNIIFEGQEKLNKLFPMPPSQEELNAFLSLIPLEGNKGKAAIFNVKKFESGNEYEFGLDFGDGKNIIYKVVNNDNGWTIEVDAIHNVGYNVANPPCL